jgi:hypothetical protein
MSVPPPIPSEPVRDSVDRRRQWLLLAVLFLIAGWCLHTFEWHDLLSRDKHAPGPATRIQFGKLRGDMSETEVTALDPKLDWLCTADDPVNHGQFGQRVCDAFASSIDGVPANRVDFLFRDGRLSFAIFEYRPDSFPKLREQFDRTYVRQQRENAPRPGSDAYFIREVIQELRLGDNEDLTTWVAKDGLVTTGPRGTNHDGNVIVLWSSNKEFARDLQGRGRGEAK